MGNIAPRWAKIASRCGNIGPTQSQRKRERGETETETEREREGERERQDPALQGRRPPFGVPSGAKRGDPVVTSGCRAPSAKQKA